MDAAIQSGLVVKARLATQLIFLVCGLGMSSWAPMVPLAKDRLALNDANLGLLLLLLGAGAMLMMPTSGWLVNRFGSRIVMAGAALVMALALPLLVILTSPVAMAVTLFLFGSGIGAIDVAMNAHGVQVQNLYGKPIMSSLHGLFSVGGLLGSFGLGFLMKLGLNPVYAAVSIAALMLVITLTQYPYLFPLEVEQRAIARFSAVDEQPTVASQRYNWLDGRVLFLGSMCFAVFLAEGAILDWSAVFLRDTKGVEAAFAGVGYSAFSIAMATMRLVGDNLVARFKGKTVVVGGSLLGAAGLGMAVWSPWVVGILIGFVLLGLGAANIVPIFFSAAGRLSGISPTVSIPAITTLGYTGMLAGPALLGFIADHFSLSIAFGFLSLLLVVVALSYSVKGQAS
ncbi:putative MFS-type transporter YPO1221/y2967/YP_0917 [Fibrisoma limi BUZ 3]|uniref:Putative MFS-type transporter YPO1221/y2967/YP_0917 n=1 Tax=Fibrisoma limi BUZ 3 TaxID=1185876 RepID=I2GT34_9BACT|nr:MFS transporter [Fibrisoma limi]CCH57063.1 putative MFS-type transporter YPO1221/y2967/YP_0917 [Fibrisoma limi BUZ 3]